jgi:hypothetical protein
LADCSTSAASLYLRRANALNCEFIQPSSQPHHVQRSLGRGHLDGRCMRINHRSANVCSHRKEEAVFICQLLDLAFPFFCSSTLLTSHRFVFCSERIPCFKLPIHLLRCRPILLLLNLFVSCDWNCVTSTGAGSAYPLHQSDLNPCLPGFLLAFVPLALRAHGCPSALAL